MTYASAPCTPILPRATPRAPAQPTPRRARPSPSRPTGRRHRSRVDGSESQGRVRRAPAQAPTGLTREVRRRACAALATVARSYSTRMAGLKTRPGQARRQAAPARRRSPRRCCSVRRGIRRRRTRRASPAGTRCVRVWSGLDGSPALKGRGVRTLPCPSGEPRWRDYPLRGAGREHLPQARFPGTSIRQWFPPEGLRASPKA